MYRIKIIIAVLLCGGLFSACGGEKDYNAELSVGNDKPHYVYTSTPAEINVSATDVLDAGQMETSLEFKVNYGVTDAKTATVEANVAPDLSLVASYNKNKGKNLLPFPEDNLSFPTTSVSIASGSTETNVPFKLVNLNLLPNGEYLLPVTIKSANASNGYPLYEKKKTSYYLITNKGAVLKGRWTFDDASNFGKASTGNDLQIVGGGFSQVEGPKGGKAVRVPLRSYFKALHGIPAGPSGRVDEYTLMIDFKFPSIGKYYTFFQTDLNNSSDATIFINKSGYLGLGSLPYSSTALSPNVWYRLIFAVKRGGWFNMYLDGNFFHAGTNFSDNRFYFDPAGVILFGDEDGDDGEFDVAEVAIYEGSMGEVRIKSLGGAGN